MQCKVVAECGMAYFNIYLYLLLKFATLPYFDGMLYRK